jgi:cold shock CspA family protein/ribosome-associated translation inhibitor RaiA
MVVLPVQITFRNMEHSDFIEAEVRKKASELDRFSDRIMSCHVVIEAPHRHHHKGKLYDVRIDLTVPGKEIVVTHSGPLDHAHEDAHVAIRDAFRAATRQIEDQMRKIRGETKAHETPIHGKITRMFPDYGFIETSDGREIYFHQNSVVGADFEKLNPQDEVRLVIAYDESAEGPQASTVVPLGKHHIADERP